MTSSLSYIQATSPTGWDGTFQMNAAKRPLTYPESEDPSVFRDVRGNYHMLTNVNTGQIKNKANFPPAFNII